jgi:hypothetical protein
VDLVLVNDKKIDLNPKVTEDQLDDLQAFDAQKVMDRKKTPRKNEFSFAEV